MPITREQEVTAHGVMMAKECGGMNTESVRSRYGIVVHNNADVNLNEIRTTGK